MSDPVRHIALITTSYPEGHPGTEAAGSFVEDFARELSGYARVTVIAPSAADSLSGDARLRVRRFGVPRQPLSLLNPMLPTHWLPILQSLRAGRKALLRLAEDDRPDHILALWALPSGYWANRVSRRYGIAYSVWALGSDIWTMGKLPLVRQVLKMVLRRAERRYADGLQLASDVEKLCGQACRFLPSTRLLPRVTGADSSPADGCKLAFLGRWHRNKGIDLLLDALDRLTDEDWGRISSVRIYGGGPLHDQVHSAVRELAERQRPVTVGGYLDKQAAAELISWADHLLLPSRIESIPVIFSDAIQLQTALIATPVGDLPRLFQKYGVGVMAADATADAFARAIQSAIHRDARSCSGAFAAAALDFNLSSIVQNFIKDLEKKSP